MLPSDTLRPPLWTTGPASFLTFVAVVADALDLGLRQQFSFPSSNLLGLLTLWVDFVADGVAVVVAVVGVGVKFARRVRRLSDEATSRFTVGGLGLLGIPLVELRSDEALRNRVLFRDVASADADADVVLVDGEEVPETGVPMGTLNALTGLTGDFFGAHAAEEAAATTEIFGSARRGRGSGRTLRSCIIGCVSE